MAECEVKPFPINVKRGSRSALTHWDLSFKTEKGGKKVVLTLALARVRFVHKNLFLCDLKKQLFSLRVLGDATFFSYNIAKTNAYLDVLYYRKN